MSVATLGTTLPSLFQCGQYVVACPRCDTTVTLKVNERTTYLYENKGSMWKTGPTSGNVIENKWT